MNRVLSPPVPRLLQVTIFHCEEELTGVLNSRVINVLLASRGPDPLEYLSAEGLTRDRPDHITSVLLLAHKALPLHEYVLNLGNVDVSGLASLICRERILEVVSDLITVCARLFQRLAESLDLSCLLGGI